MVISELRLEFSIKITNRTIVRNYVFTVNRNAADGIILENGTKIENRLEYLRRDENNGDIHGDNIIVSNSCTVVCFCTIENVERTPRIVYKGRSYRQKLCSSGFVLDCFTRTVPFRRSTNADEDTYPRRFNGEAFEIRIKLKMLTSLAMNRKNEGRRNYVHECSVYEARASTLLHNFVFLVRG